MTSTKKQGTMTSNQMCPTRMPCFCESGFGVPFARPILTDTLYILPEPLKQLQCILASSIKLVQLTHCGPVLFRVFFLFSLVDNCFHTWNGL